MLTYQLTHLEQVTQWQQKVLTDEELLKPSQSFPHEIKPTGPKEEAIKQTLKGIQYLIMDTKWDIGMMGGVNIVDKITGIRNTIPNGMNEVLKEIDCVQKGEKTWSQALEAIDMKINASADKKDHGLLNRRGENTQFFYDETKKILQNLKKEVESPDNDDTPSLQ